jgi:hypothetical protein
VTPHAFAVYCQSHPIGFALALFILSIPFSVYGSEIKAFVRLPPQRISQWVLKARAAATENYIGHIVHARSDFRYAVRLLVLNILVILLVLLLVGFATMLVAFNLFDPSLSERYLVRFMIWIGVFGCYIAPYFALRSLTVLDATVDNGKRLERLQEHLRELRTKIEL